MNFTQWRADILAQLHRDGFKVWEQPDGSIVAEKLGRLSLSAQQADYQDYINSEAEKLNRCNTPIPA